MRDELRKVEGAEHSASSLIPHPSSLRNRNPSREAVAYFASFVVLGLTIVSLGPTLLSMAERTGTDLLGIGFLQPARAVGHTSGALLGGRLYDRVGGHHVMSVALLLMAALMVAVPLMTSLWALVGVMLALGLAEGALDTGGNTLLIWHYRGHAGPFLSVLHLCFGIGAVLAPFIVAQTLKAGADFKFAYWIMAALIVPLALWFTRLESPRAYHKEETEAAPLAVPYWLIVLIASFFFFYVGTEATLGNWLTAYTVRSGLGTEVSGAYLATVFWLTFTLGRLASIWLNQSFRPSHILRVALIGGLCNVLLIVLNSTSGMVLWLAIGGLGLFLAPVFPTTLALAERRMNLTGSKVGTFLMGGSAGATLLPWLAGYLFDARGPRSLMLLSLTTIGGAFLLFLIINATTRQENM